MLPGVCKFNQTEMKLSITQALIVFIFTLGLMTAVYLTALAAKNLVGLCITTDDTKYTKLG